MLLRGTERCGYVWIISNVEIGHIIRHINILVNNGIISMLNNILWKEFCYYSCDKCVLLMNSRRNR